MEENSLSTPTEKEFDENLCANCQIYIYEPGHKINLCSTCRKTLINYPIPKWIKIFAVALVGVIIISIVRTQQYVSAAIDLGKAEKAIERKEYVTAQRKLAMVLAKFPDDVTANANMIIAASYNLDGNTVSISSNRILNKQFEDNDLLASTNAAIDYASSMFSQDTVTVKKINDVSTDKESLLKLYDELKQKSAENSLKIHLANYLFDLKAFSELEKILNEVLLVYPDYYSALSLKSALMRDSKRYDEAIAAVNKMLEVNKEDVYAISQKARIELKRKHDQQASMYANDAMRIDPQNDSSLEAKAMVDFFAGRKKECLATLSIINAHMASSGDSTISKRLTKIINGSQIYR
jgi:tetratricopeptide (TPR) repeat protein